MANPQLEDGYTRIANHILDSLAWIPLSQYEWRILWVVLRKTYGFHKKDDWIALSQFVVKTGIKRAHVCRALRMLIQQNIITKGGTMTQPLYRFNKNYDEWKPLPKGARSHHATKNDQTITKGGNEVLPKGVIQVVPKGAHTKDIITKDTFTKETPPTSPNENKAKLLDEIRKELVQKKVI